MAAVDARPIIAACGEPSDTIVAAIVNERHAGRRYDLDHAGLPGTG